MLTSLLIAAKFYDDIFFDNNFIAQVGGISNKELNKLEINFLHLTNFEIFVNSETHEKYFQNLLAHFALRNFP